MRVRRFVLIVAAVSGTLFASSAGAGDDPAVQFSAQTNPSPPWTYGWSVGLGSPFLLASVQGTNMFGMPYWAGSVGAPAWPGNFPVISKNVFDTVVQAGTVVPLPGELWLHPGPDGEYAVLRYTAYVPGLFSIAGRFVGIDIYPGVTDAHVIVNDETVFDGIVATYRDGPEFRLERWLEMGDTVDFAVGYGNGSFGYDSTALHVSISAVPEPAAVVLLIAGMAGILAVRRTRPGKAIDA